MKKTALLLVLILTGLHGLQAQKRKLWLIPSLGMSHPFAYVIDKSGIPFAFDAHVTDEVKPNISLQAVYGNDSTWALTAGIMSGNSTSFMAQYDARRTQDWVGGYFILSNTTKRLNIGFQKYIKGIRLIKQKNSNYLMRAKWHAEAGFMGNYFTKHTEEDSWRTFMRGRYFYNMNRFGVAAYVKTSWQFVNSNGKHRFRLSLCYTQGLGRAGKQILQYYLHSGFYQAEVGTRGSYLGLELGYAISLNNRAYTFSKSKAAKIK